MAKITLTNNQLGPRGHGDFTLAPGEIREVDLFDADIEIIKAGGMLDFSAFGKPAKKPVKAADTGATSILSPVVMEVALLQDQLLELGITADPKWDTARLQKELDAALDK